MKKTGLLLCVLLAAVFSCASCAQREPEEEQKPKETGEVRIDADWYREEFLAREDQEGYVPFESKYGYDLPEITGFTSIFRYASA